MTDLPGRPAYEPVDREDGPPAGLAEDEWGSPLPAEYGPLHAVRPTAQRSGPAASTVSALLRRIQRVDPMPDGAGADHDGQRAAPPPPSTAADASSGRARRRPSHAAPAATAVRAPERPRSAEGPAVAEEEEGHLAPAPSRARIHATVRHLDITAVARVSIVFYLIVLLVVVVAAVLLWYAADAFGTLGSFEKSIRTLFSLKSFTVHPTTVALYTAAGGAVLAVVGTLANILLAFIYNLISDVVGGVRVEIDTRPRD